MFTKEERRARALAATQRWRARNPEKVKAYDRKPRKRIYDPIKAKVWRQARFAKPGYREKINKDGNKRAIAVRRWLDSYKLAKGCCDCGFNKHPAALHFDHVKGNKRINVCNAKSISQAQKEIRKCVVRCANCHAIKTWPHLLVSRKLRKSDQKSQLCKDKTRQRLLG